MNKLFPYLIIGVLLILLMLQRQCGNPAPIVPKVDTVASVDTFWRAKDSIVYRERLVPVASIPQPVPSIYSADTTCLAEAYYTKNIYSDTLRADSSWVAVHDTVSQNQLQGRGYQFHFAIPEINRTVTITNTPPPKRQLYIGGGIMGNKLQMVNQFEVGLMYKDRQDRLFGVKAGMDNTGMASYGIQSYWKINLKR